MHLIAQITDKTHKSVLLSVLSLGSAFPTTTEGRSRSVVNRFFRISLNHEGGDVDEILSNSVRKKSEEKYE